VIRTKKIALLSGDGIGPEVTAAAVSVIQSVTDEMEFVSAEAGFEHYLKTGETLPRRTIDIIDESRAIFLGTIDDRTGEAGYKTPYDVICKRFDLSSQVKYFYKLSDDMGTGDVDAFLVTERADVASGIVERVDLDGVTAERRISSHKCKRLCKAAKLVAEVNKREEIVLAHDGDHMELSKRILTEEFHDAMKGSAIQGDEISYTDVVKILMTNPEKVRFIIATSLRSDYIDAVMTTLSGRSETMPMGCIGDKKGIFRPDHGPMYDIVGTNRANPTAAILAGCAMLDYLGQRSDGNVIRNAVKKAYREGYRLKDVGGNMGTFEFTDLIVSMCENPL